MEAILKYAGAIKLQYGVSSINVCMEDILDGFIPLQYHPTQSRLSCVWYMDLVPLLTRNYEKLFLLKVLNDSLDNGKNREYRIQTAACCMLFELVLFFSSHEQLTLVSTTPQSALAFTLPASILSTSSCYKNWTIYTTSSTNSWNRVDLGPEIRRWSGLRMRRDSSKNCRWSTCTFSATTQKFKTCDGWKAGWGHGMF